MGNNSYTPVTRNNLFYSKDDFDLEMELAENYIEEDTNQTVVVYRVDKISTQVNDIYKEANRSIHFLPPVEIPCLYEISDPSLKSYEAKTQNGVYTVNGNLKLYVNLNTFSKYDLDISRGDYIGVMIEENRMYYWVVTNDGKLNTANQMVVGAYKTGWRIIEAAPTSDSEFKAL
jgi:hypothetical protein